MSPTLRRPCPACKVNLIAAPARRCASCTRQYERARGSATRRSYDRAWRAESLAVRAGSPLCSWPGCTQPAQAVDHMEALRAGGKGSRENLAPMCWSHHSQKTVAQDGGFGRPPMGGGVTFYKGSERV